MKKKCYFCKASATTNVELSRGINSVPVCAFHAKSELDRQWGALRSGFAEYNAYCDNKGR